MSLKSRLRTLLCCAVLQVGALTGAQMRPDEIQELMNTLAQPKLARTNPDRPDDGDLPADDFLKVRRGWFLSRPGLSIRGASPLGLPDTRSRSPLRRLAPGAWLARYARSLRARLR